ncbi:MAG: cation:proton antiporter [Alphaproteobacteria bacterium]|nr:cation:proton antiporter [Alphaproteobacteria bacterium]
MIVHANGLLSTLVMSLVAAFAGGLAVRAVKLPPMLGYLFAGILIGPSMPGFVANQDMAADLAEVGVALLLFNIGLHFSLRDLMSVRRIAVFGALLQMSLSFALGSAAAKFLLGTNVPTAFLMGLSFAIASTAISSRILEEKRQVATLAGRIAVGWLVVQDIVAVLAMVAIPPLLTYERATEASMASLLGRTLLEIAGFGFVMFFVVRRYVPKLLGYVARIGSRELFTLSVIVIALGIAYGSALIFGVSLALGAFFAGVAISESDLNYHAAAEALSMQQIFTILFFVSVGMLFDPSSLLKAPLEILLALIVIVLGMGGVTACILIGMRVPLHVAALIGGMFAQVGEMSFVLSQMGGDWGILSKHDQNLIVAVALVSIMINPFIISLFLRAGKWAIGTKALMHWQKYGEIALPDVQSPLTDHVILVGHGRVGGRVAAGLKRNNIPTIVIESDRRLMEKLRRNGTIVIYGDASREPVLAAARPDAANLLILTIPQGSQARQIIALARHMNPDIDVIVRVHEESEAKALAKLNVSLAVMGEREIAIGLSAYALQHYGVESGVVLETLNELRSGTATPG